jgi:hypothetical protein
MILNRWRVTLVAEILNTGKKIDFREQMDHLTFELGLQDAAKDKYESLKCFTFFFIKEFVGETVT